MTTLYLLLEVAMLLAAIIIPLKGPKRANIQKRASTRQELGKVAVNKHGVLEEYLPTGNKRYSGTI